MKFKSTSTGVTLECQIVDSELVEAMHGEDDIAHLLSDSKTSDILTEFFSHLADKREAEMCQAQDHWDNQRKERRMFGVEA